jgi:hypothetical protein
MALGLSKWDAAEVAREESFEIAGQRVMQSVVQALIPGKGEALSRLYPVGNH